MHFISDLHFGHKNILAYDNREFPNIEAHDNALIERWNNKVGVFEDVWILGDISWYGAEKTIEIFNQLNGNKFLCVGNHDEKLLRNRDVQKLFKEITNYKELQLGNGKSIVLSHYPLVCYKNHFYGWYHLYGHVHNSFEYNMVKQFQYQMRDLYNKQHQMYNVGCMLPYMNYTPRTLEEIVAANDSGNNSNF